MVYISYDQGAQTHSTYIAKFLFKIVYIGINKNRPYFIDIMDNGQQLRSNYNRLLDSALSCKYSVKTNEFPIDSNTNIIACR